ncbi:MAG: hypothetical protein KKG99_11085 [Bacteroidetes bacterium]|nr:hypothetical protein [Bacteroidota bacterium]
MKIKITLIAFFASALMLTSCMKNEVSPGIESVRTAYAALLNAKAQAEIILANANATLLNSQAAYQNALAALKLAEAQGELAAAEVIRAELAADMKIWALELQVATQNYNATMAAYALAVKAAKNALVTEYFGKYIAALDTMRAIQDEIFAKQGQILALAIDVAAGTTNTMPGLVATLAAKNAQLVTLQADLAAAKALLGTPDALVTGQTGLMNDTTTIQAAIYQLLIDQQVLHPDWQAAYRADTTAKGVTSRALAVSNAAKAAYSAADASFAADFPIPTFWQDEIDAVNDAKATLLATYADTLASYTAWNNAKILIASGTTVETAAWQAKVDSVTAYVASIAALVTDSSNKYDAWVLDTAQLNAAIADTLAADAAHAANVLSMASHWFAWHALPYGPARTGDSIAYWEGYADSVYYVSAGEFLLNLAVVQAKADTAVTGPLWRASESIFNAQHPVKVAFLGLPANTTDATLYGRRYLAAQAITAKTAAIAAAQLALPDLYSEYLHWLSFIEEDLAAYNAALAHKELVRPDYEEYMDQFYYGYVADLLAAYNAKYQIYLDKKVLSDATGTALTTAKKPWTDLGTAIAAKQAEKAVKVALLGVYANAIAYNTDVVAGINALITAKKAEIVAAQGNIDAAVIAYAAGKINYDKFQQDLTSLNVELTAANAQVAFWKALLDEAIAAAN